MTTVDVARVQGLIDALRAFSAEWACDQLTATYITHGGELTTLVVGHEHAYVQNEDGSVIVIGSRWYA